MAQRCRPYAAAPLALAALLLATPSAAQGDPRARACAGEGGVSLDQRISACTAIIESGRETGQNLAFAFNKRGGAHYYKELYDRALADYDRALQLSPQYADALNNRCWTGAVVGRLQQAVDDCSASLRLEPNVANTHENRGFAYLKMGDFDRALADYEIALRLDPNRADNLYGRGFARMKKGDTGGNADIAAAKAISPKIAEEFAHYGIR
jgi:tetratricopeptide (TPR) repeat protein